MKKIPASASMTILVENFSISDLLIEFPKKKDCTQDDIITINE